MRNKLVYQFGIQISVSIIYTVCRKINHPKNDFAEINEEIFPVESLSRNEFAIGA